MYQYKVVPFIGQIKRSGSPAQVAEQLQAIINAEAGAGWEFHQLGSVDIQVKPGCIASLFGKQVAYIRFDQVVFRRNR